MNRRIVLLATFCIVSVGSVFGQQDKLITHFMYDRMSLNPGSTGLGMADGFCATTIYRNQWDKVNGAPNSAVFNVEGNLSRYFPGGIGISFYHDAIGFARQNNVLINYSFPLVIDDVGRLGIGVGIGIMNLGMSPNWVPPTNNPDASLPVGFASTNLDANFGIYFKSLNNWHVGVSSTHVPASVLEDNSSGFTHNFNTARHYYLMGGYKIPAIGGSPGDLDINVMGRSDLIKYSADINVRYIWDNKLYGGLTYRTSDAVAVMLGAQPFKMMNQGTAMDNFTIGYSYDITINQLSSISQGSHEVLLKYCHYLPPLPIEKSKHVRWL